MKPPLRSTVYFLLVLIGCLAIGACTYLHQPKFGAAPDGKRLEAIEKSPNFAHGQFQNLVPTPVLTDDSSSVSIILSSLWNKKDRLKPDHPVPVAKTDLKALDIKTDVVVWLGHSSYFVQLGGKRILIDPVFSADAAPVPYANEAFDGANAYTADDMPDIDYLLITHDHWDHLDYPSVIALESRVRQVVCGLGVGAYFEQWGYAARKIHEADWFSSLQLTSDFAVHVLPARHYSGRMFDKNKTLWAGYAIESAGRRIFFSGDSGYGAHFAEIGQRFGGFDLAVLDMGQYDKRWANIHMVPEEAARAAEDLGAKALLPAHIGKFSIANHAWDEPMERIVAASEGKKYRLLTPAIGQAANLNAVHSFSHWWRDREENSHPKSEIKKMAAQQKVGIMKIRMTINGKVMLATLADNASARDFYSMLPLTVSLEDHAGTEKISYLSRKLSTADAPRSIDPAVGDIAYYAPWGNLAIFYKDFGYSAGLVKLGQIDSGMEALTFQGTAKATIEPAQ